MKERMLTNAQIYNFRAALRIRCGPMHSVVCAVITVARIA